MANLTIEIDLPVGVTITGYHRLPEAHGVEVTWPWPETCCCPRCKTVLYVTIMTDLSDPQNPKVLAVMAGRDEKAAAACLNLLTAEQRTQVLRYRVDMGASYNKACRALLKNAKAVIDRFHVAKLFGEAVDGVQKKITRGYKKKLSKAERKEFRSRMWEFRRDPSSLTAAEKAKLAALFEKLPELRKLYDLRVEFKRIFDEKQDGREAKLALAEWIVKMLEAFPEMEKTFVKTYERWQEEILNYFDGRHTSGPVEGINNKARVITKRAYGLKSASSLWTRLVLDLNLAAEAVGQTIETLRAVVSAFRPVFSAACT